VQQNQRQFWPIVSADDRKSTPSDGELPRQTKRGMPHSNQRLITFSSFSSSETTAPLMDAVTALAARTQWPGRSRFETGTHMTMSVPLCAKRIIFASGSFDVFLRNSSTSPNQKVQSIAAGVKKRPLSCHRMVSEAGQLAQCSTRIRRVTGDSSRIVW
jgi:hypothetical protein